jgi:hypothetical protein
MSAPLFYSSMKASTLPIAGLMHEEYFCELPRDWSIVISDIRNSTAAIQRGAQNDVNLVAAGSLIAGLNIARTRNIEVPFFFGGDGGTLIVPGEILEEVLAALDQHSRNTERNFGLSMHLGAVQVGKVFEAGHFIRLSKTKLGNGFSKAIIIGDGLLWAERQVKALHSSDATAQPKSAALDMMGLECRWDRIAPPKAEQLVVCYLIEATPPELQLEVFGDVLLNADRIFGAPELRNPISTDRLKLLLSAPKMRREMLARFGRWKWQYFITEMARTTIAKAFHGSKKTVGGYNSAVFLNEIISNADTLTIDGRINTIISGTGAQCTAFLAYLDEQEAAARLRYGHHINRESIMTCYIQSRDQNHIHFVDGSDGGYTAAATELKQKIRAADPSESMSA